MYAKFLFKLKESKPFICAIFFVAYALGLSAFYHFETFLIATVFTSLILGIITFLILKPKFQKVLPVSFLLFIYLLFLGGYYRAKSSYVYFDDFSNIFYQKNVEITGRIKEIPKYNSISNNFKFPFQVELAKINDKTYKIKNSTVLVTIRNDNNGAKVLKYGDRATFKGKLTTPNSAENPSQFDYRKFLNRKGILKTFYTEDTEIKNVSAPKFNKPQDFCVFFMRKMNDMRDSVINKHSKYIKSPVLEILGGIVFGDDAINTPDEVKTSFINSGLLHLLAASGLNVALILSMWLCAIYFIDVLYQVKLISGIFIVFLYTLMTGFPPSILRASIMFIFVLIGKLMFKDANGISLIFVSGFLILLFKPEFLCDVGFQLSYFVTFGLIFCTPCINFLLLKQNKNYLKSISKLPKLIKSVLLTFSPISIACLIFVPFIAQLWAAPLQAYYFNTYSLYSVLANISVVPFIGLVSFLGFISTAICFMPKVSDIILPVLDLILDHLIKIILNISNFFAGLKHSTITVPSFSIFQIFIFYLFITFFFFSLKFLFKRKFLNFITVLCAIIFAITTFNFEEKSPEVIFFSVGNADNCLIKTKGGKYIMIDTGRQIYKTVSSAKTITLEYFYDKNINEIDTLIVTHYDSDHSGGLLDILQNVKVKNLIIPKPECSSKNTCNIKEYIEHNNIKYILPKNGQKFDIDGVSLTNIVPKGKSKSVKNDNSTISVLNIQGYKFLFMADAGISAYYSVKDLIPPNVDVLKASHHGAKNTVDDFMLKKINPKYSIISTGTNSYGHPNPLTLAKLHKYSKVLSTKELGAIKFRLKDKIEVYNYNSNKRRFERF